MVEIDRRSLLYAFGIAFLTPLLSAQTAARQVAVSKPGESRYKFTHPQMNPLCMVTSQDSAGSISMFEFIIAPKQGPPRHVHHREDETYYILTGEFLFEVGGTKYSLLPGSTIYAPRDVPHCWANVATAESRMIMACTPGGFEGFFDESSKAMMDKASPEGNSHENYSGQQMNKIMAKYGCELLGPPLFP
jgi:quercetin dioxygenase-like cupin family protein